MNESLTFKQEHAKFEEMFKTLEYAQRKALTDGEKLQFLSKRIMKDARLGLKDVMIQSTCNDYSYERTIQLLTKVDCEMSENDQTVRMANIHSAKNNNNNNEKQRQNRD